MASVSTVWQVACPSSEHPVDEVLWFAPLSVGPGEVASSWRARSWSGITYCPGPWAVALAGDGPDEVVVAHDPLGLAPLYWTRTPRGEVLVSAQLAALADHPDVDDQVDPEGLAMRYIGSTGGWDALRRTEFAAIRAVPFGHALVVGADNSVHEFCFWDPEEVGPIQEISVAEGLSSLRGVIDAALARSAEGLAEGSAVVESTRYVGLVRRLGEHLSTAGVYLEAMYGSTAEPDGLTIEYRTTSTTPTSRLRFNELDHHRYPKRSGDTRVVSLPDAVKRGSSVVYSFDTLALLSPPPAYRSSPQRFRALGRRIVPPRQRELLRRLQPGGGRDEYARQRRERRRLVGQQFPAVAAAAAEQGRRVRSATTAREHQIARLLSTETARSLEALGALATTLGLAVRAPLVDVQVVERCLTLPDRFWRASPSAAGTWPIALVEETWMPDSQSAFTSQAKRPRGSSPEPGLPQRVWTEKDPRILPVWEMLSSSRVVVLGEYVDPREWK